VSRVVVIGATGHIGTYLVPRLVAGGHEVIAVIAWLVDNGQADIGGQPFPSADAP
jgi:nucleoside-diphosphate-sugar epimerase